MNYCKCFLMSLTTLLLFFISPAAAVESRELRVGVFPMRPLNFVDQEGNAQGLNPDLLRAIFDDESRQLVFVPGSWGECYDRLLAAEIDLMTTVAYSPERAKIFDFNSEAVADIWGRVYTRAGTNITNILDLAKQPVAVARKDINGQNFIKTARKFEVTPRIIEVETHYDIFSAIQRGEAMAGVVPQHFGFREADKYGLVPTTIEFEPFSIYFAVRKGSNTELIALIDEHLKEWKQSTNSFYYQKIDYWMAGRDPDQTSIPKWAYILLLVVIGGALTLFILNLGLKRQVSLRTRELANREALFRRLSESTKAVPWELDLATNRFSYIGPRINDLFGVSREELPDMTSWTRLIHPEDRQWVFNFCMTETAGGHDHDFIYRAIHRDGRQLWIHDIVTIDMGPNGPEKLYGYFVDITEIKESEERFQKMFREHNAIMLLLEAESGEVVDANDAACTYYGYDRKEILRLSINQLNASDNLDLMENIQAARERRKNYFEVRHTLASGEVRDVESYTYPITIGGRQTLFAIIHDITERKKLFEESRRNAQLAALGTIVAGVAHEINNPIQGIVNYSEILKTSTENPERIVDIAERILKEGNRIASITRELLDYARDNRNQVAFVNVTDLINSALSLITTKIRRSDIEIVTELGEEIPQMTVNPQGIQQIVINLVDNAYDALRCKESLTSPKMIKIDAWMVERQGKSGLCLEVQDNGIGMTEEVRKKATEVFFSTKPSTEGTGLGLAIVSEIVAKHHGELDIDSCEGEYTKVRIFLPVTNPTGNPVSA